MIWMNEKIFTNRNISVYFSVLSCLTCTLSMTLIMLNKTKNEHANLTKTRQCVLHGLKIIYAHIGNAKHMF